MYVYGTVTDILYGFPRNDRRFSFLFHFFIMYQKWLSLAYRRSGKKSLLSHGCYPCLWQQSYLFWCYICTLQADMTLTATSPSHPPTLYTIPINEIEQDSRGTTISASCHLNSPVTFTLHMTGTGTIPSLKNSSRLLPAGILPLLLFCLHYHSQSR